METIDSISYALILFVILSYFVMIACCLKFSNMSVSDVEGDTSFSEDHVIEMQRLPTEDTHIQG